LKIDTTKKKIRLIYLLNNLFYNKKYYGPS